MLIGNASEKSIIVIEDDCKQQNIDSNKTLFPVVKRDAEKSFVPPRLTLYGKLEIISYT